MQVSDPNNVKIYNLSAGKSLPEWLSERKKQKASRKKCADSRRHIELIQDFEMPAFSNNVKVSPDGQFIMATGVYKPRVKCYDVSQLSIKFERCFDSEVVNFEILSDDYSKVVFLQCDRYIEFHAAYGRYFRLRIPTFGRDLKYHSPSCDLFLAAAGPEVYRLNLERGQFLAPLVTEASEIESITINPQHHLVLLGTKEGRIEAWDPRTKSCVGRLDCALNCAEFCNDQDVAFPSVSALRCKNGLVFGAGTASGQVLLYDLRSARPLIIKDHMYGLPIKDLDFHIAQNLTLSLDASVLKLWNCESGKLYTSIEPVVEMNQFSLIPDTGMMFIANENPKILTYFIPSLGPAPKWCSFLDSLTEELEESDMQNIYDDYKFVTAVQVEELGLGHLVGTNLMRAYMHGFFMDMRLYKKAKSIAEPFGFEEYRRKKIKDKIQEERGNRVKLNKLPQVNKALALKLMDDDLKVASGGQRKKKPKGPSLLQDDRFKSLFTNPDFEVDENTEEYRLLNPVVSRLDSVRKKKLEREIVKQQFEEVKESEDEADSKSESGSSIEEDSSSDDEHQWTKEVKKQHRLLRMEAQQREREEVAQATFSQPRMFELRPGEEFKGLGVNARTAAIALKATRRATLGDRLKMEDSSEVTCVGSGGSREMKFTMKKLGKEVRAREAARKHREERRQLQRPAKGLHRSHSAPMSGRRSKR